MRKSRLDLMKLSFTVVSSHTIKKNRKIFTWSKSVFVIQRAVSTNTAPPTHMSVYMSAGDSEYLGASCHPPVGVQIQG